jgi:lysophospholipase L1-like esterase
LAHHRARSTVRLLLLLALLAASTVIAANALNHASYRAAFIGDSITQGWTFPRVNLGIHGQTSTQILARFPTQIPNHRYRKVFILAGTNDTLLNIPTDTTIANISAMADIARQNQVQPILAEIPPILRDNNRYAPQVAALNTRILQLAAAQHLRVIDYYDALNNHPSGYSDGIHLKARNYLRMEYALLQTTNPF